MKYCSCRRLIFWHDLNELGSSLRQYMTISSGLSVMK